MAVIRDIMNYFEDGTVPAPQPEYRQFRYSISQADDAFRNSEINKNLLELIKKVEEGKAEGEEPISLGIVTEDVAEEIHRIYGIDVKGYQVKIEPRQIKHILNDHGKNGKTDKSMADNEVLARMQYAIFSFDSIRGSGKTKAYFYTKNGFSKSANTILCEKRIGSKSYYVVQTAVETNKKTLYVVTAFIGNPGYKKETLQVTDAKNPTVTSEIDPADISKNSISQNKPSVKGQFSITTDRVNVGVDTESKTAYVQHSITSWNRSDYVQDRQEAAREISAALGVSYRKALRYIDDINGIAKMIADDKQRLDYVSALGGSSFVSNVECETKRKAPFTWCFGRSKKTE
jgi:hypothetical protein